MIVLEKERVMVVSHDYLVAFEFSEDSTMVLISGEKGVGKEFLSDLEMVRFAGACQCAGMGLDGFQKEVIKGLYIDPDRIRVLMENNPTERVFVKLRPEEFFQLASLSMLRTYAKEGYFEIVGNVFSWSLMHKNIQITIREKEKSLSVNLYRDDVGVVIGAIQGATLGRLITPVRTEGLGKPYLLVIDEFIEPKEDPTKSIQDAWTDGRQVQMSLYAWTEEIIKRARNIEKPFSGFLRSFLKKHSISYDRKILFSIRNRSSKESVSFRMPLHYAEGFRLLLTRWLYDCS